MLLKSKIRRVVKMSLMAIGISVSACEDQPKQQHGEVSMDTTAGQDNLIIDTTASVSYGTVGEAPTLAPDLDTLTYIDKGVKPEEAFEEKNKRR